MLVLAIGTPPAAIFAVVLFLVAGVLSAIKRDGVLACIAFGLAALAWPW
jgi:hypothetical protein